MAWQKQQIDYKSYESHLLRALIDNMPDFIYIKDTQSRFVVANKHTARVMNAESPDKLIGKTDFDFYPKRLAEKFFKDEQRIMRTLKPLINNEEEIFDHRKNRIIIASTKVPWFDDNDKILGIIGIGRNITKFKEIEQQLINQTISLQEVNVLLEERNEHINHQAEELTSQAENLKQLNFDLQKINDTKDKFISIIAHDLKNPFNAIINFSELLILKVDPGLNPKQIEMIKIINSSSKMAYSLLENLLYWGKSQSSTIQFRPADLNLSDIINEVIEFHNVSAFLKNIAIVNDSPQCIMIFSDIDMVTTILRNLLSNAIKFTPKNGQIQISCTSDSSYAVVTVTDNGIGISPEQLEHLFDADKEIIKGTTGESGTGLGLLLCKEFAVKNGGDILVKSQIEKGSSFILSLPLPADF
jgi:PAS domain S-box-containing protein